MGELRIGFWNVAGIGGKDEEFWKRIKGWDVVGLVETWVEKKNWGKWKERIPKEFRWTMQGTKREGKRGRVRGGIWIGIRKELKEGKEVVEDEGLMVREVRWRKEKWKIGVVYVGKGVGKMLGKIKELRDEKKEEKEWIIGGDFKCKNGGKGVIEDGEEGKERKSKDKVVNKQGEEMIKWLGEEGWGIMNGMMEGDKDGEMTFTDGRGGTVIDYVIGDSVMGKKWGD